jgi:hypothetical protein
MVAFIVTHQVLRILQYIPDELEKQTPTRRQARSRVDALLDTLSEDDMERLRARLSDRAYDEYDTLEDLLAEGKRKNQ